jgi:hypothetical protein
MSVGLGKRDDRSDKDSPSPKSSTLLRGVACIWLWGNNVEERNPKARLVDLQAKMRKHLSTISRQIATEKRNGFVAENEDGYFLTPLGRIVVEVLRPEGAKEAETKRGRPPKRS